MEICEQDKQEISHYYVRWIVDEYTSSGLFITTVNPLLYRVRMIMHHCHHIARMSIVQCPVGEVEDRIAEERIQKLIM